MTMEISQNSIFYKGLQAYYNLSMEVKQSHTVNEFKRKLNEHLNLVANSNLSNDFYVKTKTIFGNKATLY
jgi:hypothetical protein